MSAFDFGFSYGENGASMECLFDNIDYAEFEDCTTSSDYCPEFAPNGCSVIELDNSTSFECLSVPADYGASCPSDESSNDTNTSAAAAGGLPMMTLYVTAFLWALRKFTF